MPPQSSPPPPTQASPDPSLTLAHLQLQRETILRALASKSLLAFIQCVNPVYQASQFHTALASQLQSVLPTPSNPLPSRRLIIQAPCRHGKSELSSRALPAWYLGNRPDHEVVICTHTQDLADDFGRWCRRAFQSPRFTSIFPDFALDPSSRAANRMDTRLGGGIRTVGVDGPLTGRGAHCLAEGTLIHTAAGVKPIQDIRPGDLVLTHRGRWRPVLAVLDQGEQPVVTMGQGAVFVTCTDEHLWYTAAHEWTPTAAILGARNQDVPEHAPDTISCGMPRVPFQEVVQHQRVQMVQATTVLLRCVLEDTHCEEVGCASWGPGVPRVRKDLRSEGPSGDAVLFAGVCRRTAPTVGRPTHTGTTHLPGMPNGLSSIESCLDILLEDVQECSTCRIDGGRKQPQLSGRNVSRILQKRVSKTTCTDATSRGGVLPGMPVDRGACRPPLGRIKTQRFPGKPSRHMRVVPYAVSQIKGPSVARVYDIQVAEDASFVLANGLISHNCLIIDDPIKNRQEADSPTVRDNIFNFYSSVLRTRLAPGGSIVLIMSRWHEDDLSGRLQLLSQVGNGEKFAVLDYPVLSGPDLITPLDPNRWPYEALMALKTSLLPRDWAALYMQRPTVAGTGLLNPAHLILHPAQFYASPPSTVYCAWDVAVSDASHHRADASAGVAVCRDAFNNFHILDLVHGRFPTHKLIDEIIHLARKHNAAKTFIEGGGIYKAVIPFLHDRMRALNSFIPVQSVSHGGNNKITRSTTLQGLLSSGSLHTSEALPNLPQLRHEFDGFPNGAHDDIVDALAYATNEIQKMKAATSPTNNRASPFAPAAPTQSEYLEMVKRALLSPVSTSSSPTPSTDSDLSWD